MDVLTFFRPERLGEPQNWMGQGTTTPQLGNHYNYKIAPGKLDRAR